MMPTPFPARRARSASERHAPAPFAHQSIAPPADLAVAAIHDGRSAPAANDLDLMVADRRLLGRAGLFGRVVE